MDESGRKNRLEELLARVRERGSGLHRAVGPADAMAELDARLSSMPQAAASLGRASTPASRRSTSNFALDVGSIGPGPLIEDDELEQMASRRSLERFVEAELGDDEPSVPFTEEGEGWEADPLELERSEEAAPALEFPSEPAPPHGATEAFADDAGLAADSGSWADAAPFDDQAPKLRRRESFSELPPMPLSPFPSDPPPRLEEPAPALEPALDAFSDLETNGPQALPLDVPWETLAKQLRGRRRSGEFRIDESTTTGTTSTGAQPSSVRSETEAAELRAPIEEPRDDEVGSAEPEPGERAAAEQTSSDEPAIAAEPGESELIASVPPASRPITSEPAASVPPASRPITSEPPEAIAGEPSFLRSARRSRRARKERSPAWLPIVAVALLGLLVLWWNRSDGARRSATRAAGNTESAVSQSPRADTERSEPSTPRKIAEVGAPANTTPTPLIAAATAAASAALTPTSEPPARAELADTPPQEPLGESEGWLRVRGRRFSVYLNGGLAGSTGQWMRTSCGVRHLRLAHVDPPPRGRSFPWWVDDGGPVVVPCGASTTVEVDPGGRR